MALTPAEKQTRYRERQAAKQVELVRLAAGNVTEAGNVTHDPDAAYIHEKLFSADKHQALAEGCSPEQAVAVAEWMKMTRAVACRFNIPEHMMANVLDAYWMGIVCDWEPGHQ